MPTLVTILNIGRTDERIDGNVLAPGATLVVDLEDPDVQSELRQDIDYVVLPDSAAGTQLSGDVSVEQYVYDFATDGGAIGTINLGPVPEGLLPAIVLVTLVDALTSGGSAAIALGTTDQPSMITGNQGFDSGPEFVTPGRVSSYYGFPAGGHVIGAAEQLTLTVQDAALTGGEFNVALLLVPAA